MGTLIDSRIISVDLASQIIMQVSRLEGICWNASCVAQQDIDEKDRPIDTTGLSYRLFDGGPLINPSANPSDWHYALENGFLTGFAYPVQVGRIPLLQLQKRSQPLGSVTDTKGQDILLAMEKINDAPCFTENYAAHQINRAIEHQERVRLAVQALIMEFASQYRPEYIKINS